tara:strand:+ start:1180 stop:1476 length:297 start_codon:yes stop_codon:yes gene_type:complete
MSDTATNTKPEAKAPKKDDLPSGWLTPTGLAKKLSEVTGTEIRPQRIYGYVKSGKEFPHKLHTDGRVIVDEAKALRWFQDLMSRKAESAAANGAAEGK